MKTGRMILAGCLMVVAFQACDDDDNNIEISLSQQDRDFMIHTAHGNLAEIELGELAAAQASDPAVEMFGTMMITDHSLAQNELDSLADIWEIELPDAPDSAHQQLKQRLTGLSGYSFDTAYINSQVRDHEKTIMLFETEVETGDAPSVREYANKYLPRLRMHLEKADSIAATLQEN